MKKMMIAFAAALIIPASPFAQDTETPSQESVQEEDTMEQKQPAEAEEKTEDTVTSESEAVTEEKAGDMEAVSKSESTGTIIIITEPDSTHVIFDDGAKGKSPITIEDITPGKHTIILKKKGHFAKKATVNVKAGSNNELRFKLIKPVRLSINSDPPDASVLFDKKNVGKTPYTDSKLKPGTYNILVSLQGYQKEQHTVTLGSGEQDSMFVTLMPVSRIVEDTASVKEDKAVKEDKSRLSSILDKVALGAFLGFSLIILLIELTQK